MTTLFADFQKMKLLPPPFLSVGYAHLTFVQILLEESKINFFSIHIVHDCTGLNILSIYESPYPATFLLYSRTIIIIIQSMLIPISFCLPVTYHYTYRSSHRYIHNQER